MMGHTAAQQPRSEGSPPGGGGGGRMGRGGMAPPGGRGGARAGGGGGCTGGGEGLPPARSGRVALESAAWDTRLEEKMVSEVSGLRLSPRPPLKKL